MAPDCRPPRTWSRIFTRSSGAVIVFARAPERAPAYRGGGSERAKRGSERVRVRRDSEMRGRTEKRTTARGISPNRAIGDRLAISRTVRWFFVCPFAAMYEKTSLSAPSACFFHLRFCMAIGLGLLFPRLATRAPDALYTTISDMRVCEFAMERSASSSIEQGKFLQGKFVHRPCHRRPPPSSSSTLVSISNRLLRNMLDRYRPVPKTSSRLWSRTYRPRSSFHLTRVFSTMKNCPSISISSPGERANERTSEREKCVASRVRESGRAKNERTSDEFNTHRWSSREADSGHRGTLAAGRCP